MSKNTSLESFEFDKGMVDAVQKKKTILPPYLAATKPAISANAAEARVLWHPHMHDNQATARLHATYHTGMFAPKIESPPKQPLKDTKKVFKESILTTAPPKKPLDLAGSPDWKCTHNYHPQYHTQFYDRLP